MILADLGADVIKVESPRGDLGRNPQIGYLKGESAIFLAFNRGKKSVIIDLKTERGLEVFYTLVRHSDVVIDNFRPGVVERMRVDYETLAAINPEIICCSITGFGQKGPQRDAPSFDLIHQAMSGLLSVTGARGGPPARVGIPLADIGAPLFALPGLMAALIARQASGRGQKVEVSMFQSMTFLHTYDALIYLNGGEQPHAWGTQHAYHVPWQAFETKDGYVVVATREEVFWRNYCQAIDMPELADDPRYATNLERLAHREQLIAVLEERMREWTSAEWLSRFAEKQVPAANVNDVAQALAEPSLTENGGIVDVPYDSFGTLRMLADPIHLSESEGGYGPPPQLGAHTRQVMKEIAGYDEPTIAELERLKVISTGPSSQSEVHSQ